MRESQGPPAVDRMSAAFLPLSAVITSYPMCCSIRSVINRETGSSSATRIFTSPSPGTCLPAFQPLEQVELPGLPFCCQHASGRHSFPSIQVRPQSPMRWGLQDCPMNPSACVPLFATPAHHRRQLPVGPLGFVADSPCGIYPATRRESRGPRGSELLDIFRKDYPQQI